MKRTLATPFDAFLADATYLDHLRRNILRAYRYEPAPAAADTRFAVALDALSLADLEAWIARDQATPRHTRKGSRPRRTNSPFVP